MKVLGITAEYNPFHNGHKYHIEESLRLTGADCVVAVMSGNFTQRGEAAILDKWERSRLAVENGVDLVVELPFVYACSGAEAFAKGAVEILTGLGAEVISFGSEHGNVCELEKAASLMMAESEMIEKLRSEFMQKGDSFAKAGEKAVRQALGEDVAELMLEPNNILALEYIKQIIRCKRRGIDVKAVSVKRYGSGYFEENENTGYAGASAIRKMKKQEELIKYLPENCAAALDGRYECALQMENRMFYLIKSEIIKNSTDELSSIYKMGEGLENKLKKEIIKAVDFEDLISSVVSRRYTESAVRRLLVYLLLGIKQYDLPYAVYGRVLAAGEKGRKLISLLKKKDNHMPIITNINKRYFTDESLQACLDYDVLAADMYNIICDRDIYDFSDKVKKPYMAGI